MKRENFPFFIKTHLDFFHYIYIKEAMKLCGPNSVQFNAIE